MLKIPKKKKSAASAGFDLDVLTGNKAAPTEVVSSEEAIKEVAAEHDMPEGSYMVVRVTAENIAPDPNQPRKTNRLDEEYIEGLGRSIFRKQEAPIRVRKNPNPEADADFMIIDGECRWLGVMGHPEAIYIDCIISTDEMSPVEILQSQVSANNERAEMTVAENALAYTRLYELYQGMGMTQDQVASLQGMNRVKLSRYLRLAKETHKSILDLSVEDHCQDLTVLYTLAGIKDKDDVIAQKITKQIIDNKIPGDVRKYVSDILKDLTSGVVNDAQPKASKIKLYKPKSFQLGRSGDIEVLTLDIGKKSIQIDLTEIKAELLKTLNIELADS